MFEFQETPCVATSIVLLLLDNQVLEMVYTCSGSGWPSRHTTKYQRSNLTYLPNLATRLRDMLSAKTCG